MVAEALLPSTPAAALAEGGLLAFAFHGPSWARWRAILKAAYAEPLTDGELALFREVAERDPPSRQVRELWAVCGRWSGKDSIASAIACTVALKDWRAHLRPGERASVVCLACDRDQARIVHGYIRGYFETIPLLQPLLVRVSDELLELANGVDIIVATNSYRAVRGRTAVCAILDEVAYYSGERSASPDVELYNALVPALVRVPGAMLIGISSPYRRSGLLYNRCQRHYATDGDVLVVRGATPLFNPLCPQSVIDEALAEDRERAGAEWLAEWRSDLADFLDRELVDAAIDPGVVVRPPVPGRSYGAFADPSGGRGSSFACAVVHAESDGVVVLDALFERAAPFDPSGVVVELAEVLRSYSIAVVTGDKYGAGWVTEGFAKVGIRYQAADRDRSAIYLDALPLFASGRVRLIDSVRLVHQLTTLERRVSSFGRDRVGPAERIGTHDDAANATCGALVLAASDARGALIRVEHLLQAGAGVPMPSLCQHAFAVVIVGKDGVAGCVYFAYGGHIGDPLTVCDFACGPVTSALFADVYMRLAELAKSCRPRHGLGIFVDETMKDHAEAQIAAIILPRVRMGDHTVRDVAVRAIPKEWIAAPELVALEASLHAIGGRVRMTEQVVEKMRTSPFAGALQFRAGDRADDPLRLSITCGIALALAQAPSARRAA